MLSKKKVIIGGILLISLATVITVAIFIVNKNGIENNGNIDSPPSSQNDSPKNEGGTTEAVPDNTNTESNADLDIPLGTTYDHGDGG